MPCVETINRYYARGDLAIGCPKGRGLRETPPDNPVRRVYELYLGDRPTRSSWDQVALLFAVRSEGPQWELQTHGSNHLFPNGTNQWRDEPDLDQVLILFAPDAERKVQETIESLMIRPPQRAATSVEECPAR